MNTVRPRVLVLMSQDAKLKLEDGSEMKTGFYAEELAEPLEAFRKMGAEVTVATENGGRPVVDENSLRPEWVGGAARARELREFVETAGELQQPKTYKEAVGLAVDAVLVPGGHIADKLKNSKEVGRILDQAKAAHAKIITICHGGAALLAMQSLDGRAVTAFTAEGEKGSPAEGQIDLGRELSEHGAQFTSSKGGPLEGYVGGDKGIYTAQNPASATILAQTIPDIMNGDAPQQFVKFSNHADLSAAPDKVFDEVGHFYTMAWHPGIAQSGSEVSAGTRHLVSADLEGVTFVERHQPTDQPNTLKYQMIGGLPPDWQVSPEATLTVSPREDGGSTVNILREVDTTQGGITALEGVSTAATGFDRQGLSALMDRDRADEDRKIHVKLTQTFDDELLLFGGSNFSRRALTFDSSAYSTHADHTFHVKVPAQFKELWDETP